MAHQITLDGTNSKTHSIESGNDPSKLVCSNISPDAKIKVELSRENEMTVKIFPDLKVGFILEAQKKIEALSNIGVTQMPFSAKSYQLLQSSVAGSDTDIQTIKTAIIDLGVNGEIKLGANDQVKLTLSNLSKVESSKIDVIGGRKNSDLLYSFRENTWRASSDEKKVELQNVDYLVFNPSQLPDTIDLLADQQKQELSKSTLLAFQDDIFGLIALEGTTAHYGAKYAVVLDVRGVSQVYLKKSSLTSTDVKFYSVAFN